MNVNMAAARMPLNLLECHPATCMIEKPQAFNCTSDFVSIAGQRSTMRFNSASESCKSAFSHLALRLTDNALARSLPYRFKTRLRSHRRVSEVLYALQHLLHIL